MKKKNLLTVHKLITLLGGAAGGVLFYQLMTKFYNFGSHSFTAKYSDVLILNIFIPLMLLAVLSSFLISKTEWKEKDLPKPLYLLTAVLFLASGILSLLFLKQQESNVLYNICSLLDGIFSIVSGIYFMLKLLKPSSFSVGSSIALPVWAIALLFSSYFDTGFSYNLYPNVIYHLLLISVLLFTLTETRRNIGWDAPRLRYVSASLVVFFFLLHTVSMMVLLILHHSVSTYFFASMIGPAAIFVQALSVMISTTNELPVPEPEIRPEQGAAEDSSAQGETAPDSGNVSGEVVETPDLSNGDKA